MKCLLLLMLLAFSLGGCAEHAGLALQAQDVIIMNTQADPALSRVGAGDVLVLKCYHNPGLNDEVKVRTDGSISLQLIGDLPVSGLSPLEAAERINAAYAGFFKSSDSRYVIGVGDNLSIKFYYNDELNEDLVVRPDGMISLQLVGEIPAAGLSPGQLTANLKNLYAAILDNTAIAVIVRDFKIPTVTVSVKEYASHKVYVGGEVARPGQVPITGRLRMFDAVAQVGGTLNTAELETVVLIRDNGTARPEVYSFNLDSVLQGLSPDLVLKPYDVVYIPKTAIARVDLYVEQYLSRLLPSQVSFPFIYNLNPEMKID